MKVKNGIERSQQNIIKYIYQILGLFSYVLYLTVRVRFEHIR